MVLLSAVEQRARPKFSVIAGLVLGILGLAVLVLPGSGASREHVASHGVVLLLIGTFSWAVGSLYAHRAPLPASTFLGIAMEMIAGGLLLCLVGLLTGEGVALDLHAVTMKSLVALVYLAIFGSLLGFSAYVWVLKVATPARASTYAFVNPVIAVLLGWALAGEALTPRIALAGGIIVAAVCIILYFGEASRSKAAAQPPPSRQRKPEAQRYRIMGNAATSGGQERQPMIVATTENVAAYRVKETKGQVFGVVVRSRGLGGNIMAGLRSIVGGEITEYTELLEEARRHAVDRMVQNASAMGANGIIMMRFDSSEIGQLMSEIVAYGTAVVLEKA